MVFDFITPVRLDIRTSGLNLSWSTDAAEDIFISCGVESPEYPNASAPGPNFEVIRQITL